MYVYIDEDYQVGIALTAPKAQDIERIADGTLIVLRCIPNKETGGVTVQEVREDGTLGECEKAVADSNEHGEYHVIG